MLSLLLRCVMIHISALGEMYIPCVQPRCVHVFSSLPPLSKIWIRLFSRSLTYTRSFESTAIEWGRRNWPGPSPSVPHVATKLPALSSLTTRRLPYPSEIYALPCEFHAMSVGRLNVFASLPGVP